MKNVLAKWKIDWFLVGMVVAILLAYLFPNPGAAGGWMHPEILTKAGVALIFFLHGVGLPFEKLRSGLFQWRQHIVIQTFTFLVFPVLGLVMLWLVGNRISPDLRLGFFFLCALPSTVSSSVAMTAAARGNVPLAVFNATLSSLIGIFLTPLWVGLMMKSGGHALPLGKVILDLVIWLLMPLVIGQLLRPWLGEWAKRNKKFTHLADRGTILLLIYTSFCDSVKWGVWSSHGASSLVYTFVGSTLLFLIVFAAVSKVCDSMGFSSDDRIAAVFCGSKKTLASGIPMARLMFAGNPGLSLILLPIMIYHPLQLVICGWLAGRWAKNQEIE